MSKRFIYYGSFASVDPDAAAFLAAAGITDVTISSAINQLVLDLKSFSLWAKMKAFYPFVGGTASTHKFNLKDPQDTNAAFRLVFNGGWTHSTNGALPNGTNAFANTFLVPNSVISGTSAIGFYTGTNATKNTDQVDMGARSNESPNRLLWISSLYRISGSDRLLGRNTSNTVLLDGGINTDSRGFYSISKISTTTKIYKGATALDTKTDSELLPTTNIYLGCLNGNGTAQLFINRDHRLTYISDGLTDSEISSLSTLVQTFQTTLGRQV